MSDKSETWLKQQDMDKALSESRKQTERENEERIERQREIAKRGKVPGWTADGEVEQRKSVLQEASEQEQEQESKQKKEKESKQNRLGNLLHRS